METTATSLDPCRREVKSSDRYLSMLCGCSLLPVVAGPPAGGPDPLRDSDREPRQPARARPGPAASTLKEARRCLAFMELQAGGWRSHNPWMMRKPWTSLAAAAGRPPAAK